MAQVGTPLFNKTVTTLMNKAGPLLDSLSIRVTGLCPKGYAKIYGINWSAHPENDDNALNDQAFTRLLILRNEQFDPNFDYDNMTLVHRTKDVIWQDVQIFSPGNPAINDRIVKLAHHINFVPAMKLNDASNYLIILNPPTRLGDPGTIYRGWLTVRGEVYSVDNSNSFAARKR